MLALTFNNLEIGRAVGQTLKEFKKSAKDLVEEDEKVVVEEVTKVTEESKTH